MVKTLGYALVAGIILAATAPAASAADARSGEWPLDARHLRADQVWAASRGHGVTVAVLDTGCQGDHPDREHDSWLRLARTSSIWNQWMFVWIRFNLHSAL